MLPKELLSYIARYNCVCFCPAARFRSAASWPLSSLPGNRPGRAPSGSHLRPRPVAGAARSQSRKTGSDSAGASPHSAEPCKQRETRCLQALAMFYIRKSSWRDGRGAWLHLFRHAAVLPDGWVVHEDLHAAKRTIPPHASSVGSIFNSTVKAAGAATYNLTRRVATGTGDARRCGLYT